ncbi:hypothetical protein COLO4_27418 [Corchorus olitorius]|uniref:Zinc knuckle CX2CX4HX4C n=1 Tax=Corchorus olitorius TaxID=93759 RepID=A0A1R3HR44_9ROSI|nr:hypothetical protein COLO4_27418 [Corchorus olitorius]
MIGTPIKIDVHTGNTSRGRYARICLEVNCKNPLPSTIKIGYFLQDVHYEVSVPLCSKCGGYNHLDCSSRGYKDDVKNPGQENETEQRHQKTQSPIQQNTGDGSSNKEASTSIPNHTDDESWQVVSRKGNRKKKDNNSGNSSSSAGKIPPSPPLNFHTHNKTKIAAFKGMITQPVLPTKKHVFWKKKNLLKVSHLDLKKEIAHDKSLGSDNKPNSTAQIPAQSNENISSAQLAQNLAHDPSTTPPQDNNLTESKNFQPKDMIEGKNPPFVPQTSLNLPSSTLEIPNSAGTSTELQAIITTPPTSGLENPTDLPSTNPSSHLEAKLSMQSTRSNDPSATLTLNLPLDHHLDDDDRHAKAHNPTSPINSVNISSSTSTPIHPCSESLPLFSTAQDVISPKHPPQKQFCPST